MHPFSIVEDNGFCCIMKTGRPEYYLPSHSTLSWDVRKVFKRGGLYTPQCFPYGFHMEWVESNAIPWTPYGLFFGWQPSHFFIPHPLWSPYGFHMEWPIPWTFHVLVHVDSMEFPMNLHCKFMYYSIWIPWNSPYGFQGRIHIKFHGKPTNGVVKNSVNIKNRTSDSTTHHVHGQKCVCTAEPYDH